MAAKNKFKGRGRTSISREAADLQDLLGLHHQACLRAEEVEEQIQELHAAGKFPEARVLRMQSLGIQQGLRAIEAEVRSAVRPPKQQQPASLLDPAGRQDVAMVSDATLLEAGDVPFRAPGGAPRLGPTARSLGADFETAMDAGISFEVPR